MTEKRPHPIDGLMTDLDKCTSREAIEAAGRRWAKPLARLDEPETERARGVYQAALNRFPKEA